MSINFNLKKILVASAALLMALSAGAGTDNVANAKHRRYHYRTHRTYRVRRHRTRRVGRTRRTRRNRRSRYGYIYGHKLYYLTKPVRRTHHSRRIHSYYQRHAATRNKRRTRCANHRIIRRRHHTARLSYHQEVINDLKAEGEVPMRTQPEIKTQEQAAREQTLTDLNNDRASVGEGPVTEMPDLDSLAQERAWQIDHDSYSHDDPQTGEAYTYEDGNADIGGENIDQTGDSTSEGYGVNGNQGANEVNDAFFNDEKPSYNEPGGGGHYSNITLSGPTNVGIGVYYNGQDGTGYNVAEDFQ